MTTEQAVLICIITHNYASSFHGIETQQEVMQFKSIEEILENPDYIQACKILNIKPAKPGDKLPAIHSRLLDSFSDSLKKS